MAAPAPTDFARVLPIIFIGLGVGYTVDLAISTNRDYKDKRLFPLKNAPAKEKVARIHDIINKKGERTGFMTLGELAKDLKALGGIWNALAEVKVNK